MPLQATSGAASYDAFGGGAAVAANYIEDVFSTWLYTGTGQQQTIPNGIDLAGKGGMIWTKARSAATSHILFDTVQGWYNGGGSHLYSNYMSSNSTAAQAFLGYGIGYPMLSNGYTIGFNDGAGTNACDGNIGANGVTFASWTFREQPKFFDVVTWVGNGVDRDISHNLQSVPGCIIIKRTDSTGDWIVYHRGLSNSGSNYSIKLNTTAAEINQGGLVATSTTFTLYNAATVNTNGATYVAYVFAHNAGGFGLTGTDNVISCGSYTGNGSTNGPVINLGYEPQWLLLKRADSTSNWRIIDNMRGWTASGNAQQLFAEAADAEGVITAGISVNSTGFQLLTTGSGLNASGGTYIYIAIRRGPMKTPTTGTSVFSTLNRTGTGTTTSVTGIGLTPDLLFTKNRFNSGLGRWDWQDRLRGPDRNLFSDGTDAEYSNSSNPSLTAFGMDGVTFGNDQWNGYTNYNSSNTYINYFLRRAPGFFDEVCYTGTGSARTVAHNLGVAPELMIVKRRDTTANWSVYAAAQGPTVVAFLNTINAFAASSGFWNDTNPTASVFTVGNSSNTNASGGTYVTYLFASAPGVSKVGSYTGNSSSQTINCGFTNGARFVMIKRTDNAGDWYVWDSARGITSGNDPYLLLNKTDAEVTTNDTIDPDSSGFIVNSTFTDLNGNGASYIYLAIA